MNLKYKLFLVLSTLAIGTILLTQCKPDEVCTPPFGIVILQPTSAGSQTVVVSWNSDATKAEVELLDKTTNVVQSSIGTSPITFIADPTHPFEVKVKSLCDDGGESEFETANFNPKYALTIDPIAKQLADSLLFCPLLIRNDSFFSVQNIKSNFYEWSDQEELLVFSAATSGVFSTFFMMKRSGNAVSGTTAPSNVIFMDGNVAGTILCDNLFSTDPFQFSTQGKASITQSTITINNPDTGVNLVLELHPRGFSIIGTNKTERINFARRK